jgi:hypothetical protein
VKILKGNVTLSQREWLAENVARLDLLLPGKQVKPGDSWEVPELAALKLIRSFMPPWAEVLDVSSLKLKCRLLEVTEGEDGKLARISMFAEFGPRGEGLPAPNIAGNIVRITSYGMGSTKTLNGCMLMGDCTFDLAKGCVTLFRLFGALLPSGGEQDARFGNTNRQQTTYGFCELEVKSGIQKPEK